MKIKMSAEEISSIRLQEAYFCLNCEVVTNCVDICPACGNKQLWSLENWLGSVEPEGEIEYFSSDHSVMWHLLKGINQVQKKTPGLRGWTSIGRRLLTS